MKPLGVLIAIAEGRRRHAWELQSHLMAHVAACLGVKDARADRFNPYADRDEHGREDTISFAEARAMLRSAHG